MMIALKKKYIFFLLAAAIITSGYVIWMVMSYSYPDLRLLLLLFVLLEIELFIVIDYNKHSAIFTLGIMFNLFAFLYSSLYFFDMINTNQLIPDSAYKALLLFAVSVTSFNVSYTLSRRVTNSKLYFADYNNYTVRWMSFTLMLVSFLVEFFIVFKKIGIRNIIGATRAQTSILMEGYGLLSFYRYTFPLLAGIFLLMYFKYKKRIDLSCFLLCFVISTLNAVMYVSRANMLALLFPVAYLLERFNKFSKRQLILASICVFILFGLWKGLFSNKTILSYNSEFTTWYRIFANVTDDSSFKFQYGVSYLKTLINLIIPVTNTENLSNWYVKTYEYSTYIKGGGRGFSEIVEAYLNFGVVGNIVIFFLYGLVFKKINDDDDFHVIIYIIFMLSIYQIFRSDSYSMWKNMMWFRIYPTIIIFLFAKRIKRRDESADL